MPQPKLTPEETRAIQEALDADYKAVNIRLRKGEYQYSLAEAIASYQLKLGFPDVKEIIRELYGIEKTEDTSFVRKIQTILKKMERNDVVRIMKKRKPWELQRYSLSSLKFQDVDKSPVVFASDQQIEELQNLLDSMAARSEASTRLRQVNSKTWIFLLFVLLSYAVILWDFSQPLINPLVFIAAFSIAVMSALALGRALS
ncbi:hypothetical protein GTO27_00530 [Candidatus Bathyarchaeota archaeon]|nr:hypothetical protein [Candidatus Bathyarchaeota archaeon]